MAHPLLYDDDAFPFSTPLCPCHNHTTTGAPCYFTQARAQLVCRSKEAVCAL